MQSFFTLGTDEIHQNDDQIIDVNKNNYIKPLGGLWATKYNNDIFNLWIDFIINNTHILFYKYPEFQVDEINFVIPCSKIVLKRNAKIFELKDEKSLNILKYKYPNPNGLCSYENLSKDYDGIYVDLSALMTSNIDEKTKERLKTFGINSLVLFNTNCINYYYSGNAYIELAEYHTGYSKIMLDETPKKISKKPLRKMKKYIN